jgi:cytochrome P450
MTTAKAPPAPDGLPVLGHALAFSRNPLAFLERAASEHGDVVALSMPGNAGVLVAHPDEIERVLVSDADTYPKGDFQRRELSGLLGDGSLIADGDTWRRRREALQPAFFARRIEAAEPVMRQATRRVTADWTAGDTIDVHDTATTLTLSVLAEAFLDVDAGGRDASAEPSFAGAHEDVADDADRIAAAADAIADRFAHDDAVPFYVPDWVPLPSHRRYRRAVSDLESIAYGLADTGADDASDVLAAILDSDLGREELRDELVTLLLAGHETTSTALTATVSLLASNPAVQARVYDTITDADDPTEAPLLRAAIDEALRLYPPVHLLMREAASDTELGGYHVPEGSLVVLPSWVVHRDARWWDDPGAYRPRRFVGESDRPEFSYFPFGGGQRQCIGRRFALQELRVALAELLADYRFEATANTAFDPSPGLTLRPGGSVEVRLRQR